MNRASDWILVQPARCQPAFRLYCFPHAGAGPTAFHGWNKELPATVEVRAIRLPGRESRRRERFIVTMGELVEALVRELDAEWNGAYGFFGHSMGGRVAFELTRALLRTGRELPRQLWLSGSRPPHLPLRRAPIHGLPDAELIAVLTGQFGAPEEVLSNPELAEMFLPVLRADFSLHERHTHQPGPALPVPFSVFGGSDDPVVLSSELEAWSEHTSSTFQLRMFPGGHLYLKGNSRPLLMAQLTEELQSWLPGAEAGAPPAPNSAEI